MHDIYLNIYNIFALIIFHYNYNMYISMASESRVSSFLIIYIQQCICKTVYVYIYKKSKKRGSITR